MSKDGKHNKHIKNQGYLETLSNFFSTLAFKLSSDNFVCDFFFSFPFSLLTELPINMYVLGDAEYDV